MNALKLTLAAVLAAAAVQSAAAGSGDAAKQVIGTWQLTRGVVGGRALPKAVAEKLRLELTPGRYRLIGAESPDSGTWTIHGDHRPLAIDIKGTDGPNKGKTFPAIAELHGDTMRICYDLSGKRRPAGFASAPKTLLFLAEYRRVKQRP